MKNKMKQYHIFHCISPLRFTETEIQPRQYVGFVEANSIEESFQKSQNGGTYNSTNVSEALPWNPVSPCRSTSVGDVIQDHDKFFMVCGIGFKELIEPKEGLSEEDLQNECELNSLENQSNEQ